MLRFRIEANIINNKSIKVTAVFTESPSFRWLSDKTCRDLKAQKNQREFLSITFILCAIVG